MEEGTRGQYVAGRPSKVFQFDADKYEVGCRVLREDIIRC